MAAKQGGTEEITREQQRDTAQAVLRVARWSTGEVTDSEMRELIPQFAGGAFDHFIFSEEYAVSTGCGISITEKGRLYIRMLDGL